MSFDAPMLLEEFRAARSTMAQRALWDASDPALPINTCRYCGKHWRRWNGSQLDGHAACIVTDDFKHFVREIFRISTVTYEAVGKVIGVSPAVVRSWTFPVRSKL